MPEPVLSSARTLAVLELHCPACDEVREHWLDVCAVRNDSRRRLMRARRYSLSCTGCGEGPVLTGHEKDRVLRYARGRLIS